MKSSKLVFAFALVLGLSSAAFAGERKNNETKDPAVATTTTEAKTQAGVTYYWFQTDPSSGLLTSRIAKSNTQTALDPSGCNGNGDHCGLAYDANDTHVNASGQRELNTGINESQSETESLEN